MIHPDSELDEHSTVIELPFRYGEIVYHKLRTEKTPGMISGFQVRLGRTLAIVQWTDPFEEKYHDAYELQREHSPIVY